MATVAGDIEESDHQVPALVPPFVLLQTRRAAAVRDVVESPNVEGVGSAVGTRSVLLPPTAHASFHSELHLLYDVRSDRTTLPSTRVAAAPCVDGR